MYVTVDGTKLNYYKKKIKFKIDRVLLGGSTKEKWVFLNTWYISAY